jgi:hypothetical protein
MSKTWIWIIVIVVILLVLYFVFGMGNGSTTNSTSTPNSVDYQSNLEGSNVDSTALNASNTDIYEAYARAL